MIGLTATAYSGTEDGIERTAMDVLNYQIYKTSNNMSLLNPAVNRRQRLGDATAYEDFIKKQKGLSAVLIYVNDPLYSALAALEGVKTVTEDTPDEDLR